MSVYRLIGVTGLCAANTLFASAAAAASVEVSGLTPTLGGAVVEKRVNVKFDDLNPNDAQGAAALFQRLTQVASKLCASNSNAELLADRIEKCRAKAVRQAVKDIDTPALSAAAAN